MLASHDKVREKKEITQQLPQYKRKMQVRVKTSNFGRFFAASDMLDCLNKAVISLVNAFKCV